MTVFQLIYRDRHGHFPTQPKVMTPNPWRFSNLFGPLSGTAAFAAS
jgi:hypothetical protein